MKEAFLGVDPLLLAEMFEDFSVLHWGIVEFLN